MAPIIGRVHIGYLPQDRVVGISKLAQLVDVYAKRLQIQEKMTAEIANCLNSVLKPHGVGVGGRGWARMHDDKMRAQAGRHYGHKLLIGSIQDTTGNSPGVSFCHQFEGWVMIPSSQGAPPPDRRSSALVRDPLNQGGVVPNEHVALRNQATIEPES